MHTLPSPSRNGNHYTSKNHHRLIITADDLLGKHFPNGAPPIGQRGQNDNRLKDTNRESPVSGSIQPPKSSLNLSSLSEPVQELLKSVPRLDDDVGEWPWRNQVFEIGRCLKRLGYKSPKAEGVSAVLAEYLGHVKAA